MTENKISTENIILENIFLRKEFNPKKIFEWKNFTLLLSLKFSQLIVSKNGAAKRSKKISKWFMYRLKFIKSSVVYVRSITIFYN